MNFLFDPGKKIIAAVAAVCLLFAGCTKDFDAINTNPRLVTAKVANPLLIFTKVQKESVFNLMGLDGRLEVYSGYTGNGALGNIFAKGPWSEPFGSFYTNYIINISEVIRLSQDDPSLTTLHTFARIWKVWLFSRLTDLYGDIPYFDAAKDVNETVLLPRYDTQKEIYEDLFKELKESVAVLKADNGAQKAIGKQDLIYNGNTEAWIRFANSLRLRLAMRVRYVDLALASSNINDVTNDQLIVENTQNAALIAGDAAHVSQENKNPYYNSIPGGAKEFRWTSFTMVETLTSLDDPRIDIFIKRTTAGDYFGLFLSLSTPEKEVFSGRPQSELGEIIWRSDFTFKIINTSEVYFLRAEAALKGITTENANALYVEGIRKSLQYYNVAEPDIVDYLASPAGTLTGSDEEKLEQIIVQKWLANYYQIDEAYAEFRRTGYPRLYTGSALSDTNGEIPRRLQYPLSEFNSNGVNLEQAAQRLSNGDALTSRIWWDANPDVPKHHPQQGVFPPM
ncbi:MAG: SusD/RagB family nutrient-binding outer membrane lipoprotein [Chitinophagaceae bacterium]|nr:SusD/RagB family nutrient-binding outer membrane lipoprotein [Chitinophagaceae bacterium]